MFCIDHKKKISNFTFLLEYDFKYLLNIYAKAQTHIRKEIIMILTQY